MENINNQFPQVQLQNVTLRPSFSTLMTPELRDKIIFQVLNKGQWELHILNDIQWHKIFPHVKKGNCTIFDYYYQLINYDILQGQLLFKSIQSIQLDKLTYLGLSVCQINNIQPISFMNIPNITAIFIYDNQFYNVQPILKTKFKFLEQISFSSKIPSIDQIYRFQLNSMTMIYFYIIHSQKPEQSNVRPQNLNSWAKIQNFRFGDYDCVDQFTNFDEYYKNSHYIYQKKSLGCIQRKFMFSLDHYRRGIDQPQINNQ